MAERNGERGERGGRGRGVRQEPARAGVGIPVVLLCVVVALVLGGLLGRFVIGGGVDSAAFPSQTSVAEGDLDRVIATYVYDGKQQDVTVRDALESQVSLDQAKNKDGSYAMPTADEALAVARNRILAQVAKDKGITVSDDELSGFAQQILGEGDLSALATKYQLTEDQTREIVRESAMMYKLKQQVVGEDAGSAPTAPEAPAADAQDQANATYGAYIVGLLGDEWDSANNAWARTDGPFYAALSDETFSADSATYAQAQKAYNVAYQQYYSATTSSSTQWTNYVNGLLSSATIKLYTLTA